MARAGLKTAILTWLLLISGAAAQGKVESGTQNTTLAVSNGETTLDTRIFYFNRSFDKLDTPDSEALNVGGILKYESASYKNFRFGLAYYGSFSLGIADREKGVGSGLLQADGDDISFLGEAYVDFNNQTNQLKIGPQRLSTPLMNDRDIRLLPTAYEAAVFRNKSLEHTTIELGYVSAFSGFVSTLSGFEAPEDLWGKDGLAYIFLDSKFKSISVRGQFVDTLENSGKFDNYGYIDGSHAISAGQKSHISIQLGHTGYQSEASAKMYGLKLGTSFGKVDVNFVFNVIRDNEFKTVNSGPLYTDWQQGYTNYEPSDAAGVLLIFNPNERSSIKIGYVDIDSKDGDAFSIDSYGETNLDIQYKINKPSSIRLRYSNKNPNEESVQEDRDDFRIIYYFNF